LGASGEFENFGRVSVEVADGSVDLREGYAHEAVIVPGEG
jgi:hypothetical protein